MRQDIHPTWYPEAQITCACGNTWTTGATVQEIRTDVCSSCHPFYTGEQRIVDTEGQVDRFLKRLKARDELLTAEEEQREMLRSPELAISELELGTRYEKALAEAGVTMAGQIVDILNEGGDEALLAIKGFGHKALIDVKRKLRTRGFMLNEEES
ncbi:MAG: 50S ribosomal protein L31 [Anaerolineae bacterium]|nr:50S ribosomal protein L31 [Anaerolineae bacterium]